MPLTAAAVHPSVLLQVHNDMHILRTGQGRAFYPTVHHPDLIWSPLNYTSRAQIGRAAVRRRNGTTAQNVTQSYEGDAEEDGADAASAFVRAVVRVSGGPSSGASAAADDDDARTTTSKNITARAASFKTREAPSPRARAGHSLVAVGRRLLLFGGILLLGLSNSLGHFGGWF